jgi:beta-lactamase class A
MMATQNNFRSAVAIAAALLLSATPSHPQGTAKPSATGTAFTATFMHADTAQLHRTLESIAAAHRGIVGYSIHNLDTGERLERRGDETFPTASLIKVPIMVTVFDLVAKGKLSLDDPLTLLTIDKVGGAGVLYLLHNGLVITVRDAVALMIATSDNTATNLLLDRILIRRVWDQMEALGLSVAPDSTKKYGLGVTTPNEMARLFELIARGKAVDTKSDSTMLSLLDENQDGNQMQRYIAGVRAPHKTGSVDASRTECAIFFLQSRVVACALTKENVDQGWLPDNEAQVTLGRIGETVVNAWPRAPTPKAP